VGGSGSEKVSKDRGCEAGVGGPKSPTSSVVSGSSKATLIGEFATEGMTEGSGTQVAQD
jgi:hypothetical protein